MARWQKRIYEVLTDDNGSDENMEGRLAENAPGNFLFLLLARFCSKVGDRLASPKTTLAWLLQTLGAPPVFTGLIVPLRESGSLLPQIVLGNYLKRFPVRKWAWSAGAVAQGLAIAGCAVVAVTLTGMAAGVAIVSLMTEGGRADLFFFPAVLFLVSAAHAGVRVGRKTHVVDMAGGNKRTDYVSTSNTLIGIFLVLAGLLTGGLSMVSVEWALGVFAGLALVGALYGRRLVSTEA